MKILIVDDDPLICKSLTITLAMENDIEVLASVYDGEAAIRFCDKQLPDVVLMDIQMPKMNGIQAVGILKSSFPAIRIVMLTTFHDKSNIQLALHQGADGYLLKTERITNIAQKLRLLVGGTTVLDQGVMQTLTSLEELAILTPRENDVLVLVARGLTNKEIAGQLFLSEGTVRNLVSIIMEKTQAKNRTELSLMAVGKMQWKHNFFDE